MKNAADFLPQRRNNELNAFPENGRISSAPTRGESLSKVYRAYEPDRIFLLRGITKVKGERSLICTTHNLLTLWRQQTAICATG